jgi:hypothetical protein
MRIVMMTALTAVALPFMALARQAKQARSHNRRRGRQRIPNHCSREGKKMRAGRTKPSRRQT